MVHGTADIRVHSMAEPLRFCDAASNTKSIIDLTITLLWDATDTEVRERGFEVDRYGRSIYLHLEGTGFKDHPIYTTGQGSVDIHSIVASDENKLKSVTFANVIGYLSVFASMEYITFIPDRCIVTTSLPDKFSVWRSRHRNTVQDQGIHDCGYPH